MDTELVMGLIPLAGGFLLDKILGDPLWLPHPVVGFGKLISRVSAEEIRELTADGTERGPQ